MSNLPKINREFADMERELKLFEKQIHGLKVWERIRHQIVRDIRLKKGIHENLNSDAQNRVEIFKKTSHMLKNVISKNPFLSNPSDLLFVGRGRRKMINGEYWDTRCDPLIEAADRSTLMLEELNSDTLTHHSPARTQNLRYLDLLRYGGAIPRRLGLVGADLAKDDSKWISKVESAILEKFGCKVDVSSKVKFQLKQSKILKPQYRYLLSKIDPSVLMLVNHNDFPLVRAAQEEGVKTAEIQHSMISKNHMAYSFEHAADDLETFPDYFLSWGEEWSNEINLPFEKSNVVPIGNAYLETRKNGVEREPKDQIIVVSQWSLCEELSELAIKLEGLTDSKVVYKLHPREVKDWRERYQNLTHSDVEVETGSHRTLYELFSESKAQVGVYSGALYEGLAFGLQTFIADLPGSEMAEGVSKFSTVKKVSGAEEIPELLGRQDSEFGEKDQIFEPKPKEKFRAFLRHRI